MVRISIDVTGMSNKRLEQILNFAKELEKTKKIGDNKIRPLKVLVSCNGMQVYNNKRRPYNIMGILLYQQKGSDQLESKIYHKQI